MKHITILVPEGQNNLTSIVGAYKIFKRADEYQETLGKKRLFNIQLGGLSKEVRFHGELFSVHPDALSSIRKTDLVIIPSLNHDYHAVDNHRTLATWIKRQHLRGAEVASFCTGAFLLASSGLLNGKECSTHWSAVADFHNMFPLVSLVPDKIITDENGIYTSGGAFSFLNLVLYLVEKYYGRKTALYCSKVFQIDIDRSSQSPFTIFSGLKDHGDDVVSKAQQILERSFNHNVTAYQLASRLAIGRRTLDRRFIKATGHTPIEYLHKVKVELAKRRLETGGKTVSEIMNEVGYSDDGAFRSLFKKITGLAPVEYRKKFGRI
jgi:transcriptional regulator GlxA family with amidase domain